MIPVKKFGGIPEFPECLKNHQNYINISGFTNEYNSHIVVKQLLSKNGTIIHG